MLNDTFPGFAIEHTFSAPPSERPVEVLFAVQLGGTRLGGPPTMTATRSALSSQVGKLRICITGVTRQAVTTAAQGGVNTLGKMLPVVVLE